MPKNLSRVHRAPASSLLARKPAEPRAKWSARAERRRPHRATWRTNRGGITGGTRREVRR
jgi:hypothetical protein